MPASNYPGRTSPSESSADSFLAFASENKDNCERTSTTAQKENGQTSQLVPQLREHIDKPLPVPQRKSLMPASEANLLIVFGRPDKSFVCHRRFRRRVVQRHLPNNPMSSVEPPTRLA